MGMHMSEVWRLFTPRRAGHTWLAHGGEVAQWSVQLLGWLWLGQQGMRLGWPVASGVLAVALWWAVRVLCRGMLWTFQCPSWVVGWCGGLTAAGVCLHEQWGGHVALLALAAVWGVWSALVETRHPVSTLAAGRLAWHPLVAAGLLGWMWRVFSGGGVEGSGEVSPGDVGLWLGLCSAVLFARDRQLAWRAQACTGATGAPQNGLAPSAMGLMMGTLWLGHDWCLGTGWTTGQVVSAHVVLMAALPVLVACLLHVWPRMNGSPVVQDMASLALMALGALMWLGNGMAYGLLAMLLPSVAWALHCNCTRAAAGPWARMPLGLQRCLALCCGPVLLVGVGMVSPEQGPLSIQWALASLGVLAGIWLVVAGLHAAVGHFQEQAVKGPLSGATAWRRRME